VVECSNCGAGPEAWAAVILVALSFLVAAVALVYTKRSADATDKAVALAREETQMSRTEHEEFLREVRARARLAHRLSVYPLLPAEEKRGPEELLESRPLDARSFFERIGVV
jgi:hypothetical protein